MDVRAIRNDHDHAAALKEIERLWGAAPGSEAADRLEVLAILADDYERRHWPVESLDPIEALRGHMDMNGYTQSDLGQVLGSQPRASEVLRRRRPLTLDHIRRIESAWKLPAAYLVAPYALGIPKVPTGTGRRRPSTDLKAAS